MAKHELGTRPIEDLRRLSSLHVYLMLGLMLLWELWLWVSFALPVLVCVPDLLGFSSSALGLCFLSSGPLLHAHLVLGFGLL